MNNQEFFITNTEEFNQLLTWLSKNGYEQSSLYCLWKFAGERFFETLEKGIDWLIVIRDNKKDILIRINIVKPTMVHIPIRNQENMDFVEE